MIKGIEVLFFEEAEIQKMRGNKPIFAAVGPLSVLYFKDYNRFVLRLNDWRYPLMRRLNISGSDRNFALPGNNNATFNLRILGNPAQDTLKNFETILMNNSRFGGKTLEASPDDKLIRHKAKETSIMDKVSETAKNIIHSLKAKTETVKTGTKHINSTKKRTHLKDIKNKDFKKTAHTTFKKDFFDSHEKMTMDFLNKRRDNPNLNHALGFNDLLKTSDAKAPTHYLFKEEIEESILNNKEILMTK
jgi:hypothetical protein